MRIVQQIFDEKGSPGSDYAPGSHIYTRYLKSPISDGIAWFENQDEVMQFVNGLPSNIYKTGTSHVITVKDAEWGYEATFPKTQKVLLNDYFNDPNCLVVCRKLRDMDEATADDILEWQDAHLGIWYDTFSLVGHALAITTRLQELIPAIRQLPPIGHLKDHWVCSPFACDAMKQTDKYKNLMLFTKWNIHRIHVHRMWNGLTDNYKDFHLNRMRTGSKVEKFIYG